MNYYISYNGQVIGPMAPHQLMAYHPNTNTMISLDGINWQPLYVYPELMQMVGNQGGGIDTDSKRILCGIMAMLFGVLGIQYFIVGKIAGGFITILLSLVTCGLWEIITFIQGIMMLCMSDSDFRRKYIDSTSTLPIF